MRRNKTSFAGTALFTTFIVGTLTLGVWFGRALIIRYLSTEQTLAGITFTPYGYKMGSLLDHSFDSLSVSMDDTKIKVVKPVISATLLQKEKHASVSMESIDAYISLPPPSEKKKEKLELSIPEKLKIPIPVSLQIGKASVALSDGKKWSLSDLSVKNKNETSVDVKASNIRGSFIQSPASINLSADFSGTRLNADVNVATDHDHVKLKINAPKDNLTQIKTNTDILIKNPKSWIPVNLPSAIPAIGALSVSAEASVDINSLQMDYKAKVKTRVGEFWPLLPLNAEIDVEGNKNEFKFVTNLRNDEGGSIYLKGDFDTALNGTVSGKVDQMSAQFGPQMMPMDLEIRSVEKAGNSIDFSIETRQGSIISGTVDTEDGVIASFTGDLTPYEPWALDWVGGNVILEKDTKINGYFDGSTLHALAKFNGVPFAYHMKADSVHVALDLNPKEGIVFNKGMIFTPAEHLAFNGEVIWGTESPHTKWNVEQKHGGSAGVYIAFGDTLIIDAKAKGAVISTVPFADIKIGEKIDGKISGHWTQNFVTNMGEAELSIEGHLDAFAVEANILARQIGDTIYVDQADAFHNKNAVQISAGIVLPNDSNPKFQPTGTLPIQMLYANLTAREFSIPLLLESFNDSTLSSGMINGKLSYLEGKGLSGNMDFSQIRMKNIDSSAIDIRKLNLSAQNEKVEINANVSIGDGGWGGNTQVIVDNIFSPDRHVSITHGSDIGGSAWIEGFINKDFVFSGSMNVNGSWNIPGTLSEIKNTDLNIDVTANIKQGLSGITADIRSDSTIFQPPKMDLEIPIFIRGHLEDGILNITEASIRNELDEAVIATVKFTLDSMKLEAIDVQAQSYTLIMDEHTLRVENVSAHLEDNEDEMLIAAELPKITYSFNHDMYGEAEALARGDISFSIPHSQQGQIKNKTVSGNVSIDKLVYQKSIDIEVTPSAIQRYIGIFNNLTAKLRKKDVQEEKISTASPINLSLHISDSQYDSVMVVTPFVTFPFTFDVWVLGSTTRPLLRGDITNTNSGFIGVRDIYEFALHSFQVTWNDDPWQRGVVDVTSSQELHYCSDTESNDSETCPINLDIQGTITNPQPIPSSNCGTETSSAAIYYNVFLGCIADGGDEGTDWNKLAGKAIGKVISATANKTLGGDYIGDIDMKVMLFDNTSTNEKDSSYFKVPVSMDRWVRNLSLIFGYTQDQSDNPTYDQALQFGINYTLPFFQEDEFSHKNHLSPSLSLNALLISKQYLTNTGTGGNENRVEKNIGINYTYRFWNPCLLGIGICEDINITPEYQETGE